jgi:hypothetical protein
MAGVTGLEPATFGVTGHLVSQENQGVFRLLMRRNGQEIRQELERMAACRAAGCWYGPLPNVVVIDKLWRAVQEPPDARGRSASHCSFMRRSRGSTVPEVGDRGRVGSGRDGTRRSMLPL